MITEEKIKQVRKQLRSGVPQGEIKNELAAAGYTEEDIDKIFTPHRPDMRSWFLFFAVLFLLIGLYRIISSSGFLMLLFSAGMFSAYALELKRIKRSAP